MRQTRILAALLVAAVCGGCSKHATEPPPPGPPSPVLVATQPPHRAVMVLYDADIWGQFDRALDRRTVSTQTAFLKLDGQRIPCTVSYDTTDRRIVMHVPGGLQLLRTYTVEYTTAIRSTDGVPLPPNVFFQFTTNSLKRTPYDFPAPDSLVGPLSRLAWGGTQIPMNNILYELYLSEDSLAVANRTAPMLQRSVFVRHLPSLAWPRGRRLYWAITTENTNTQERMHGPVTSFRILDETTAVVESVLVRARDHGSNSLFNRIRQYCNLDSLPTGPIFNAAIHWDVSGVNSLVWIVGATVTLTAVDAYAGRIATQQPTLWQSQNEWLPCSVLVPGPPYPEVGGLLGSGVALDPARAAFTSDRLGAFFEAKLRNDPYFFGTLIRTDETMYYCSPRDVDPARRPALMLRFVRPTAVAAP